MIDETLKMLVMGYTDNTFTTPAAVEPFKAHVNPDGYTKSVMLNFSETQAPGTSGAASKHNNISPETLQFDFLLDRTGALGNSETGKEGVSSDIEHFKNLSVDYEGEIHEPRFLKLVWGTLLYKCRLQSLEVEHKMFSPQGLPLRAILKATFREYKEPVKRVIEEGKSSPDLTHVRQVKEGDTLPLMTHRIYGDSKYYLEVARVNGLTNFRKLEPGREIMFPPIEKIN